MSYPRIINCKTHGKTTVYSDRPGCPTCKAEEKAAKMAAIKQVLYVSSSTDIACAEVVVLREYLLAKYKRDGHDIEVDYWTRVINQL